MSCQSSTIDGQYTMSYVSSPKITAPTTIFLSPTAYQIGYCTYVIGATVTSRPGAALLTLTNNPGNQAVVVRVEPGRCIPGMSLAQ